MTWSKKRTGVWDQTQVQDMFLRKIKKFDLKSIQMAQYGLISNLEGALWLRIISKPLLTLKKAMEGKNPKRIKKESQIGILPIKETRPHCKLYFQVRTPCQDLFGT